MMLSPKLISSYQVQSLAHAREAAMLTFGALQQLHQLSLRGVQVGAGGMQRDGVDAVRGLCHASAHVTSSWLIDLVKVFESQWALSHRCAHAALSELHKWTPREMDTAVAALDLALDAAEYATENMADAAVTVVKRIEDESDLVCAQQSAMDALAQPAG